MGKNTSKISIEGDANNSQIGGDIKNQNAAKDHLPWDIPSLEPAWESPNSTPVDNQQEMIKDNIATQTKVRRSEDSSISFCPPGLISEHEAGESDICGDINNQNTVKENLQRDSPSLKPTLESPNSASVDNQQVMQKDNKDTQTKVTNSEDSIISFCPPGLISEHEAGEYDICGDINSQNTVTENLRRDSPSPKPTLESPNSASGDNQQENKKDNKDTQTKVTNSEDSIISFCPPGLISEHEAGEFDICGDINNQNTVKENLQRDSLRTDFADDHEKPEETIEEIKEEINKEIMEISSIKSEDTSGEQSTQEPTQNKELNQNEKMSQDELKKDNPKTRPSLVSKIKNKKKEQQMQITQGTSNTEEAENCNPSTQRINDKENLTSNREEAIPNSNSEHEEQSKKKKKQKDKKDKKKKKNKKDDSPDQYQTLTLEPQTHGEKTMDNANLITVQECKQMEESNDKDFPHPTTQCKNKAIESETFVDKHSQKADEENLQLVTPRLNQRDARFAGISGNRDSLTCVDSNNQIADKDNSRNHSRKNFFDTDEKAKESPVEDIDEINKDHNETSSTDDESCEGQCMMNRSTEPNQRLSRTLRPQSQGEKTMDNAGVIEEQECKQMEESSDNDFPSQIPATQCEDKVVESETCVDNNSQKADEDDLQLVTLSKKQLQDQLKKKDDELKRAREEADYLRQRFSKLAGAKMTEGNPNIADLSDPNRPTNLATKYRELYDNEWTNAYEKLTEGNFSYDEKKTITLLRSILVECYEQCMTYSKEQWKKLATALSQIKTENPDKTLKEIGFQETEFKDLKTYRRMAAKISSEIIVKKVKSALIENGSLVEELLQELDTYIEACTRLSWEMALQDPPLHMFWDLKKDDPPNDMFKTYTQSGKKVSFVVWPCLLRQEDGDLLAKGVYQLYE
ncbi:glutamic acid-rich protein-like isoform X3 [Argopecten irradians]|uniref:glutamic acid-rich protein-like isoform X3 n=1 Tax=Argopecten irradians TaxID=31199 RepID=UPI00371D5967